MNSSPNAYIVVSAADDDHGWYCSEQCARTSPYWRSGLHGPEETYVDGLACENESCPVDDLG